MEDRITTARIRQYPAVEGTFIVNILEYADGASVSFHFDFVVGHAHCYLSPNDAREIAAALNDAAIAAELA